MAGEVGPFPRYRGQPRGDAPRHPQPSPRRLQRPARAIRGADHHARRHRRPNHCPAYLLEAARRESDRMLELGEKHGFRNAQVNVYRADRNYRSGHGLRHDRHRARLRPGQVQEARRRRLLQDHQRLDPAGPGPARLHAEADRGHRPLLPRLRHACRAVRTSTPPACKAKGFPDEVLQRIETQLPGVFELPFAFNRWTIGDDVLTGATRLHPGADRRAWLRPADGAGLHAASRSTQANAYVCGTMTIEGAPHLKTEHLPVFDCANGAARLGQRFLSAGVAHPHDGGRAAVHLRARSPRRSTCRTTQRSRT